MKLVTFTLTLTLFSPALPAHADDADLELSRGAAAPKATVGQKTAVSLTLLPRTGARLDPDAPLVIRLSGEGVKLSRALYQREDAVDPRAVAPRFELQLTPERADWKLSAHVTAWVCRGVRCRPVESDATWPLD
jgi:hypothetical protein